MSAVPFWAGCLILLASGTFAAAQPAAERPRHRVGDVWTYQQVDSPGDTVTTATRTVVEVLPSDRLRVRTEAGETVEYDLSGSQIDARGPEYSREFVRFPIKVGDKAEFRREVNDRGGEQNGTSTVSAYESLTVPAGTFDCFRIDIDAWTNRGKHKEEHIQRSRWYCPAVRWIARDEITREIATRSGPATRSRRVTVLVSYAIEQ